MSSVKKGINRFTCFLPIVSAIIGMAAGFLLVSTVCMALKMKAGPAADTGVTVGSVMGIAAYIITWIFLLCRKTQQDETR